MQATGQSPDLTAGLAAWLPILAAVILGAWKVYDIVKAGRKKLSDDQKQEIHSSVAAAIEAKNTFEDLAEGRRQKLLETEKERDALREERDEARKKLRDRLEIEDGLQRKVFSLQGNLDEIDRRVRELEGSRRGGD